MGSSYGLVEVSGVAAAMDALDIMCKTADVEFITWERKMGGRLVTLIIQGDVSAVTQAVEAACAKCIKKPVSHGVIANPHSEIVRLAYLSASRFRSLESVTARAANPAGEIEPPIW
ncbi:MAG: BMC domain-containing protein [Lachnospiraceae bacterium]|nr:BMC domain-containing protein [Lachnospiraceae bacterium]